MAGRPQAGQRRRYTAARHGCPNEETGSKVPAVRAKRPAAEEKRTWPSKDKAMAARKKDEQSREQPGGRNEGAEEGDGGEVERVGEEEVGSRKQPMVGEEEEEPGSERSAEPPEGLSLETTLKVLLDAYRQRDDDGSHTNGLGRVILRPAKRKAEVARRAWRSWKPSRELRCWDTTKLWRS